MPDPYKTLWYLMVNDIIKCHISLLILIYYLHIVINESLIYSEEKIIEIEGVSILYDKFGKKNCATLDPIKIKKADILKIQIEYWYIWNIDNHSASLNS